MLNNTITELRGEYFALNRIKGYEAERRKRSVCSVDKFWIEFFKVYLFLLFKFQLCKRVALVLPGIVISLIEVIMYLLFCYCHKLILKGVERVARMS